MSLQELATFSGYIRIDSYLRYLPNTVGVVTGVYRNSFSVKVMDFLLNFCATEDALHPLGIQIPEEILKFVREGQKVKIEYPNFVFTGHIIETEPRHFFVGEKQVSGNALRENVKRLLHVLNNFGRCSEVSGAYLKKEQNSVLKPIMYLCMQMKKERRLNLDTTLSLFGAGEGLTPAWDDFCAGMLLADRFFHNNLIYISPAFFSLVREKSTFQSYWQLKFAEVGKFSLVYERLLNKIQRQKLTSTEIVKCINYGHSSGTDLLSGIHSYLQNMVLF